MKEIKRIAFIAMFAGLMLCLPGVFTSEASAQGAQDFVLVNKTGIEIYAPVSYTHLTLPTKRIV